MEPPGADLPRRQRPHMLDFFDLDREPPALRRASRSRHPQEPLFQPERTPSRLAAGRRTRPCSTRSAPCCPRARFLPPPSQAFRHRRPTRTCSIAAEQRRIRSGDASAGGLTRARDATASAGRARPRRHRDVDLLRLSGRLHGEMRRTGVRRDPSALDRRTPPVRVVLRRRDHDPRHAPCGEARRVDHAEGSREGIEQDRLGVACHLLGVGPDRTETIGV